MNDFIFCHNPKCSKHIQMSTDSNYLLQISTPYEVYEDTVIFKQVVDTKLNEVKRQLFESVTGKQMYLCDTCSEAIKLLMGK